MHWSPKSAHPSSDGVNDGSGSKIELVAKLLKAEGFPQYSMGYLRAIRATASAFTAATRVAAVSFSIHRLAGDPKTFEAATEQAKQQGKPLTVSFVQKFHRQRLKEEKERERAEHEKLKGKPEPDAAREKALEDFHKSAVTAEGLADHAADSFARYLSKNLTDLEREDLISAATAVTTHWGDLISTIKSKQPLSEAAE